MEEIIEILKKNGFINTDYFIFENKKCKIKINKDYYEVFLKKENGTMYSDSLEIYWLIGVLIYNDCIDKFIKS